jgi:Xaa-Pro aminopeptidase
MIPLPRVLLERAEVPAFLVTNLHNIRYLSGLKLSYGFILVLPRSLNLFVDDRYREAAGQQARAGVTVRPLADLERVMRKVPICGLEEEHVTLAQHRLWKSRFEDTKFVRTSGIVEEFRRAKDASELRMIRRAHRITQEILRRVPAALRAGITERALAWKLETWAYELGADDLAFPPVVAFGTHTSRPHHAPTTRALQKGHLVQVDVGAVYKGYCADRSEVYFTADPAPAEAKALAALKESLSLVISAIKPGAVNHELDALARDVLAGHGYEKAHVIPHALGHGVGLEVHEGITLSQRRPKDEVIRGEVLAVEPGLYFPGKFGMRLEEMVIVE